MKEKLKAIKIIHIALVLGISLAYFVVGDLQTLDFLKIPKIESSTFIYLLIPVTAIFLGNFLYNQQLKKVGSNLTLEEKIGHYQTASLIRWAMLEGAAFFVLFVKKEIIVIGLFLILYMVFLKPSEKGMKRDFEIVGK